MPDPLLVTKVSMPILRQSLVPRKRVLKQFREGIQDRHLLILVSAPAGYGKTTAVRMWVEETHHPVAWVTLDKSDNDPKQFLQYTLTALQQVDEYLGQAALEIVEYYQEIDLQQTLGLLINDLYDLEQPTVLVLEDFHLIENQKIDHAIDLILNQSIPNLHLVITTREDPNLPLPRLRVRNQLTEIRAVDLSFSLEEADAFLTNVMGLKLSIEDIKILKNRTEGWAAGLQLAGLSLKGSRDPADLVMAFRGTQRHVLNYLIDEVLNGQPKDVREFLQRTSILDQLSPSLCEAVTGKEDSRRYLHYLEENNLFLVSLDNERIWYRYHALFGELLKNQLLQTAPERVDELHERAADWYEKNGSIQNAVEHAFQVSTSSKVSELIENHALQLIYQGEVSIVLGWFERLAEPVIRLSPMLCICKAWSLALMQRQTSRTEEVEQVLRAAEEALDLVDANENLRNRITGYAASIQAFTIGSPDFLRKEPEKLIEISQQAQKLLPQTEKAIRSVNAMIIGNGYSVLADLPAAERAFKQTFEDGASGGNYYAAIYGPINLILIALIKGQLKDALKLCETNIEQFNRFLTGQRFPPIGALHILRGCILLEENRIAEAEQDLMQGLSLVRWTGEFRTHIKGYSALARLRSIQGDPKAMQESIKSLEETRPEAAMLAQALRHRFALQDKTDNISFEKAHLWMTEALPKFRNLPVINGVDPLSEIDFRTYLSAAFVLARLAEQNPKVYSLLEVHNYLSRQEKFAEAHDLVGWLIEIWIVRALLYQAAGKSDETHRLIIAALSKSAQRGYFRIFLDEGEFVGPLLKSVEPYLNNADLSAFTGRLLDAMPGGSFKGDSPADKDGLSDRELEVLHLLAAGLTYKEIGQSLFLSLNTVQFHIKSIYRKLLVHRRVQAIEKAREMELI